MKHLTRDELAMVRDASLRRLDWAEEHLARLNEWIAGWQARNPVTSDVVVAEDRLSFEMRLKIDPAPDVERWGFLFGDAVNNMRSALDNILVGLTAAYGGTRQQVKNAQYPIVWKGDQAAAALGRIAALPEEVQFAVSQTQPVLFTGEDPTPPDEKAFAVLNRFSNQDKHRLAVAQGVKANEWQHRIVIEFEDERPEAEPVSYAGGDLVDGSVLLSMNTAPHRIKQVSGEWSMKGSVVADLDGREVPAISALQGMLADSRKVVVALTTSAALRDWYASELPYCFLDLTTLEREADELHCSTCGNRWDAQAVDDARNAS